MVCLIGFRDTNCEILRVEISKKKKKKKKKKKMLSQQKIPRSCIFKGWHFTNSSLESNIP